MIHINKHKKKASTARVTDVGVPPLTKPQLWFKYTDRDRSGSITQEEVIISICTHLRPTKSQHFPIRNKIQDGWDDYDLNHNNKISEKEFLTSGMVPFLLNLEAEWKHTYKNEKPIEKGEKGKPSLGVDPQGWFEFYDNNNNGVLSKDEVYKGLLDALRPTSQGEADAIKTLINKCWDTFDVNNGGTIEKWEFLSEGGMADYLMKVRAAWKQGLRTANSLLNIHCQSPSERDHTVKPPPPISASAEKWFLFIDVNNNGFLERDELTNGLIATFNAVKPDQIKMVREHVESIWDKFDRNDDNKVSKGEFICEDGLANNLKMFEKDWKLLYDAIPEEDEGEKFVKIKVGIPPDAKPGSIIKVASPVSDEIIMAMVPDKVNWGGGGGSSYFMTVKFSVDDDE